MGTPLHRPSENDSTSSSIREWADASGVDEYYVEKLESQSAQFLEDVARLYVDSLTPPPTPTSIGSAAGVLSFDSIQLEGMGGLGKELDALFTQAFSTRMVPNQVIKELGLKQTRGVILHGPPGTGKTLIARDLGRTLDAKEVTVVAGPEILSTFLGDSEERVRILPTPEFRQHSATASYGEIASWVRFCARFVDKSRPPPPFRRRRGSSRRPSPSSFMWSRTGPPATFYRARMDELSGGDIPQASTVFISLPSTLVMHKFKFWKY